MSKDDDDVIINHLHPLHHYYLPFLLPLLLLLFVIAFYALVSTLFSVNVLLSFSFSADIEASNSGPFSKTDDIG